MAVAIHICSLEIPYREGTEEEVYVRINLEEIKEIPKIKPIQAGTQIVTYTTMYLLLNAENMHELKLKSTLEIAVYKKLKEVAAKKQWTIRKENDKYIIGDNVVEILDGSQVRVNGKFRKVTGAWGKM